MDEEKTIEQIHAKNDAMIKELEQQIINVQADMIKLEVQNDVYNKSTSSKDRLRHLEEIVKLQTDALTEMKDKTDNELVKLRCMIMVLAELTGVEMEHDLLPDPKDG